MEKILTALAQDRELLNRLRQRGTTYVRECLTWDAEAERTTRVELGRAAMSEPDLPPPKDLHTQSC